MSVDWPFADCLSLAGSGKVPIKACDAERQTETANAILADLADQPGIVLADEVGMGKTYVALAVAASVLVATKGQRKQRPVVIMVPSGLRGKWKREWSQFKQHCVKDHQLDWVKDTYARSPADFFRLLDDSSKTRCHLIFMTTGCFTQQRTRDPWVKLAMIRMARPRTRLTPLAEKRLCRWAASLVGLKTVARVTESLVKRLLNTDLSKWQHVLKSKEYRIFDEGAEDPFPDLLKSYEMRNEVWKPLINVIRQQLPRRSPGKTGDRKKKDVRGQFHRACEDIFKQWLKESAWESPLLILDEAHHAKNDKTNLAELFRESTRSDTQLLADKFQRMLFLTATPFQLGHQELVRILRSFGAIHWEGRLAQERSDAKTRFVAKIDTLEKALNENRQAGRDLDKRWGKIKRERLGGLSEEEWWQRVSEKPQDDFEVDLGDAVTKAKNTRDAAQRLLRPWVVRHNHPTVFVDSRTSELKPRRVSLAGRAILDANETPQLECAGLPVAGPASLPFMLSARVQGEMARYQETRAFFAEGLASSYEAFHHTRKDRQNSRDIRDDGREPDRLAKSEPDKTPPRIPVKWYEEQIANLIPSKTKSPKQLIDHPKIHATVDRAVKLWSEGKKVLVFCYYRETCKALFKHIRDQVEHTTLRMAVEKLGAGFNEKKADQFLRRVQSRLKDKRSPLHGEVNDLLTAQLAMSKYSDLNDDQKKRLAQLLFAYFRTPSFIVRNLLLNDQAVQAVFESKIIRQEGWQAAIGAFRHGIQEHKDGSGQTCLERVGHFLDFAVELAERSQCQIDSNADDQDDEQRDPLEYYLNAVSYFTDIEREPRSKDDDSDKVDGELGDLAETRRYRAAPLVRHVHGESKIDRERLAFAFNSPLFPEILISSRVMGEGIDLHRFCRHVIHHDGCWNPSTLEQQTGRLDRIRSQAEVCSRPIVIYQPFIAGSADEKMYRVLRDRERWFQIVMGQDFKFDEASSEAIAVRVPLPDSLAKELTFDLTRWQATSII